MFLKKLFNKDKKEITITVSEVETKTAINNSNNIEQVELPLDKDNLNNILVLYWISKKKKGYILSSKKFPKYFYNEYGINFNLVVDYYIQLGYLLNVDDVITITELGTKVLKEYSYVIYIFENKKYNLKITDFTNNPNLGKISNNDIAWGVFNNRTLNYTLNGEWTQLSHTYYNMASLLISERKFETALDFIFATVFLQLSGMEDKNYLKPLNYDAGYFISEEDRTYKNGNVKIQFLELFHSSTTLPFCIVNNELSLTKKEIKEKFINSRLVASLEEVLPFTYFNREEAYKIFEEAYLYYKPKFEKGATGGYIFTLEQLKQKVAYNEPDRNSTSYFYKSVKNQAARYFNRE